MILILFLITLAISEIYAFFSLNETSTIYFFLTIREKILKSNFFNGTNFKYFFIFISNLFRWKFNNSSNSK